MDTQVAEVQDMNKLAMSLDLAKDVITRDYLYQLSEYSVAELPEEFKELDIADYTRIFKFAHK